MMKRRVFITGGTGYLGRALVAELLARGHEVRALVRRGSEGKLPAGCEAVLGDPLDEASFAGAVAPSDTFVQLVMGFHVASVHSIPVRSPMAVPGAV